MKFNTKSVGTKTVNRAGGRAYKQSPELELVSLLLTSFVADKHYEGADEQLQRLEQLSYDMKDKLFLAKAAVYARNEFGMRSITHALAAHIGKIVKGKKWTKRFFDKVVHRPDDILEILSFYMKRYGKPLPNSMKKGLSWSLKKFDAYQLAKYRGSKKDWKMVDVINLIHPTPDSKNRKAIQKLMAGELKNEKTWEAKLTKAGQDSDGSKDKKEKKAAAWGDMVKSKKIGYFALLRNLRNIIEDSPETVDAACELLVNRNMIKKSLVFPFRYRTAYNEIAKLSGANKVLAAIDDAVDIAVDNVPKFPGKTLIALDESGSMSGQPWEIGTMFAAVLMKSNPGAHLRQFSTEIRDTSFNPKTPVMELVRGMSFANGGTDFGCIFRGLDEKYDRIIVLSDMQGWAEDCWGGETLAQASAKYKQRTGANPHIYSFDLNGYGDMKFPESQVYCLAGFSEKIFDVMKILEEDRKALINKINSVKI